MTTASRTAVTRPKTRYGNTTFSRLIDQALVFTPSFYVENPHTRRSQQVVDVPAQAFGGRQMALDPRFEIPSCAARIAIQARRKIELTKAPDDDAHRHSHFDQQLIGPCRA